MDSSRESGIGYILSLIVWGAITFVVIWSTVGLIVALLAAAVVVMGLLLAGLN